MIVGGTGSFGNAFLDHSLQSSDYSEILIFSRDEKKQHDMRQKYQDERIEYIIGDVRDYSSVNAAMRGVDVVFHAAALKHVPTGEFFPNEVIKTNCEGSKNVFEASQSNNVRKVILLSTDKAVYPINTMGMTKALAEKLLMYYSQSSTDTIYNVVRYGNVMASRGSVVPLFVEKILKKQILPITDFAMTRFMLTLSDAINLVEFAIKNGGQGNLYVQKAKSFSLDQLIRAFSQIYDREIPTRQVGSRPGEKLHETLATHEELVRSTNHPNYFEIAPIAVNSYENYYSGQSGRPHFDDFTSQNTERLEITQLVNLLKREIDV